MLSLLRWPCLLQDVLNRRLLFKTISPALAPKPSPIISSFLELGGCRCSEICGGAENVVRNPANISSIVARFYYFDIYTPLEAYCVLLTIIAWVAHRYGQLYLLLINILLGSFQLFCYWSASLWGWNNPVRRCLPVGAAYPPEASR